MTKKRLNNPFCAFSVILVVIVGCFFYSEIFAITIFEDNFDAYSDGDLVGQGDWEGIPTYCYPQVESGTALTWKEGCLGVYYAIKQGATTTQGEIAFNFKVSSSEPTAEEHHVILQGDNLAILVDFTCFGDDCGETGLVEVLVSNGISGYELLGYGAVNYWHSVQIQWNTDLDKARFSLDEWYWTQWFDFQQLSDYVNAFRFGSTGATGKMILYLDDISATTTEKYEEEFPDFPLNCEGLSTFEWLFCQIYNLVGGIFLPSQAKMTELKNTIDLVQSKAPFNYVSITKDFIDYVRTETNATSEIQFSLFNQAGSVDFSLWNTTTTIAGISQKISEIAKIFLTFLILLIFLAWLLSFLRRVF